MSYQQTIYNLLRQNGLTEAGALGVLGNFDCESNCEPNRLQNDYSPSRGMSKAYVNAIEQHKLSIDAFSKDSKGFGLAQWTYGARKFELYDDWQKSGKHIDDVAFQVGFAIKELKRDFPSDFKLLCSTNDIYEATKAVCERFENPQVKNVSARFQAAARIKHEIDLNNWSTAPSQPSNDTDEPKDDYVDHSLNLRTIDHHCEEFLETGLLMDVLALRNYDFDCFENMWDVVRQFQRENGLVPDGVVGQKTWDALLKR